MVQYYHLSVGFKRIGADGARGGGNIPHPGTFLLWVSWVLGGILSSGLVARSPCSRLERGVGRLGDGMLLDGP